MTGACVLSVYLFNLFILPINNVPDITEPFMIGLAIKGIVILFYLIFQYGRNKPVITGLFIFTLSDIAVVAMMVLYYGYIDLTSLFIINYFLDIIIMLILVLILGRWQQPEERESEMADGFDSGIINKKYYNEGKMSNDQKVSMLETRIDELENYIHNSQQTVGEEVINIEELQKSKSISANVGVAPHGLDEHRVLALLEEDEEEDPGDVMFNQYKVVDIEEKIQKIKDREVMIDKIIVSLDTAMDILENQEKIILEKEEALLEKYEKIIQMEEAENSESRPKIEIDYKLLDDIDTLLD
jgi:hypothetical protein